MYALYYNAMTVYYLIGTTASWLQCKSLFISRYLTQGNTLNHYSLIEGTQLLACHTYCCAEYYESYRHTIYPLFDVRVYRILFFQW